eukprot:PhM_4_TR9419/c0_g1_i1/m.79159
MNPTFVTDVPQPGDFTPSPVKHNVRLGVLFLTCGMPIFSLLSRDVIVVALAMLVGAYFFDLLNYRKSTVGMLWLTVLTVWGSVMAVTVQPGSHHPFHEAAFSMLATLHLACYGMWGTIQFMWLQSDLPELVIFIERTLLAIAPLTSVPLYYTTIVAFIGVRLAPFVLCFVLCALHRIFFIDLKSSWMARPVLQRDEFASFTVVVLVLPAVLYLTSCHRVFVINHFHTVNIIAVVCIPATYLLLQPTKTLAFMMSSGQEHAEGNRTPSSSSAAAHRANMFAFYRRVCLVGCLIGVVHWVVARVLMSRYGHLLLGLKPPLNEIVLNFIGFLAIAIGMLGYQLLQRRKKTRGTADAIRWILILFLSVGMAVLLAVVTGMPRFYYPLSSLCAASLTAYLLDRRNINNFMLFATGTTLSLVWWMFKTFAFLRHDLNVIGNSVHVSLQSLSLMILWCYVISCVVFSTAFSSRKSSFKGALYIHALFVHSIEHILYSQPESSAYPPYLVFLTSAVGIYMSLRLLRHEVLCNTSCALVASVYVSKIFFFLGCMTAQTDEATVSMRRTELAAELSALWWSSMFASSMLWILALERSQKLVRAQPSIHYIYGVLSLTLSIACRNNIIAFIAGDYYSTLPAEFGAVILFWCVLLLPIVYYLHPENNCVRTWRSLHAMVIALGLTLMVLFSPSTSAGYAHILDSDTDSLALVEPLWARPLGIAFLVGLVATLLEAVPFAGHTNALFRLSWWCVLGTIGGFAFSGIFLPFVEMHCILFMCVAFVLFGLTIDVCHYYHTVGHEEGEYEKISWWIFGGALSSLIFAYYLVGNVDVTKLTNNVVYMWEIHTASRSALLALCAALNILVAVLLKCLVSGTPLLPYVNAKRITNSPHLAASIALVCNYATIVGYVCLLLLNYWLYGSQVQESDAVLHLFSSATLLLLHQDGILIIDTGSNAAGQFLPPVLAATVMLVWTAFRHAAESGYYLPWVLPALTMPSHCTHLYALLCGRGFHATAGPRRRGAGLLADVRPHIALFVLLNSVCILFTTSPAAFWLGVLALAEHALALYTSKLYQAWHFEGML